MNNVPCIYLQEDENYNEEKNLNENKILLNDENKLKKIKKKKKKKREKENENEKIVLFENNDIVEYDANYLCAKNNHIVLLEEDYLSILEHLIEKKYYPDIKKLKNELISRSEDDYDKLVIIDQNCNSDVGYPDNVKDLKEHFENKTNITSCDMNNLYKDNENLLLSCSNINDFSNKNYKLVILPNGKKHKINLDMSLREFQKKYTSEDNKSFEYLIKKMKNKSIEKNFYSIAKRNKHNLIMEQIENYTKKGVNCHLLNTNKSENESYAMMFSSSFRASDIDNMKKDKLKICYKNTRFSQEYNKDIEKQINQSGEIKELKLLKKEKENKEDQMIERGKFNLLTSNNQYEYVKTPLIQAGKGIDKSPIITWGNIISTPKLIERENEDEEKELPDDSSNYSGEPKKNEKNEEGNDVYIKNEFNLQKINKREIIAEKLQGSLKNIKYNKEILKKKNFNYLINKNYSSRMSSTSFKNSVLSKYSQKRLSELALKSSLASQILNKKRKK